MILHVLGVGTKKEKFFDNEDSEDAFLLFIFLLICFIIILGGWFYFTKGYQEMGCDVKFLDFLNDTRFQIIKCPK